MANKTYTAPLRDLEFAYYELFDAEALTALPGYEEAGKDTVIAVAEELGKMAEEMLAPLNPVGDEQGCRLENGKVITPEGFAKAFKTLADGGWIGLTAQPEHGGQGLPHAVEMISTEMMCAANLSFAMYVGLTHGAYSALGHHASDEVKAMFMPPLAEGRWAGTMCLTEPQCGTDLGLISSKAEPVGDGSYRLTGTKIFISAGDHDLTENIVHLVLARLPDAPEGIKGISLFVVPKLREEGGKLVDNHVSCGGLEHKMGIKGSSTCVINFDGSIAHLVGEPHRGMPAMFTFMNGARLHVGIQGYALAEAAYQRAVHFARERRQGRSLKGAVEPNQPADSILVHPDVRRMLLFNRAFVEGARALTAWVALELDHVHHHPDPKRRQMADDFASLLTPVVKAFHTDLGSEACNLALQVAGGYGYVKEYGFEQLVRDVRITQIYEGTNGIQALDLVGRKLSAHMGRYLRRFFHPVQQFFEAEAGNAEMQEFVEPAAKAFERLQRATGWLAQAGMKNPEEAGAAATDYLHLFGWTAMAYIWARTAKVALAKQNGSDATFYRTKLATARFFMARMLPRSSSHFAALMAGSGTLMAMEAEAF
jgi:butyryl-CoA dehydrogenase